MTGIHPIVVKDTPALREEVYRKGVVVQNLKDDKGAFNGLAVIWADKYYGLAPAGVVLASVGILFFASLFVILALIIISEGSRGGNTTGPLAWLPGLIALGMIGALIRFWYKHGNARRFDTLRCLAILPDGGLHIPFGIPGRDEHRRVLANYEDVTGIQLSPEAEWGGAARSDNFYILLQTESGQPVFIGLSNRGKAQLQPVVVALHKAWETMRPFVTAHRAVASGQPIVIEDAP